MKSLVLTQKLNLPIYLSTFLFLFAYLRATDLNSQPQLVHKQTPIC